MTALAVPAIDFDRATEPRQLLRAERGKVRFIDIQEIRFLMIDGTGAPGSPAFRDAFGALYPVAYTLRFSLMRRGIEAHIGALEGLYWFPGNRIGAGMPEAGLVDLESLVWRLMLPIPAEVTDDDVAAAIGEVARKKTPPALPRLQAKAWKEGPSAQTLHVGSYDAERPTIALLEQAIAARGLGVRGPHHEIYLSDPNRTAADRLRTIIRLPIEAAA